MSISDQFNTKHLKIEGDFGEKITFLMRFFWICISHSVYTKSDLNSSQIGLLTFPRRCWLRVSKQKYPRSTIFSPGTVHLPNGHVLSVLDRLQNISVCLRKIHHPTVLWTSKAHRAQLLTLHLRVLWYETYCFYRRLYEVSEVMRVSRVSVWIVVWYREFWATTLPCNNYLFALDAPCGLLRYELGAPLVVEQEQ